MPYIHLLAVIADLNFEDRSATAYQHHHQVHDFLTQTKVLRDGARHSNRLIPTFHSDLTFPLSASHSVIATEIQCHPNPTPIDQIEILFPMTISHCTIGVAKLCCWLSDDVRTKQPGQDEAVEAQISHSGK